jgi:hypothetical protein
LDQHPDDIWDVLKDGSARAIKIAEQTIREAKEAIGLP